MEDEKHTKKMNMRGKTEREIYKTHSVEQEEEEHAVVSFIFRIAVATNWWRISKGNIVATRVSGVECSSLVY